MDTSADDEPSELDSSADDYVLLHVHDFPQLYQKPSASALLEALALLSFTLSSSSTPKNESRTVVSEEGVPRYLTLIVSSSLSWIQDEDLQESIWSVASTRLSERSGRNAMPATTRSFRIDDDLVINLHEPTLTEDNLGLKTWMSSLLLSRRLRKTRELIPGSIDRVLELGAGTGLVGIAAASLWKTHVVLTDLPNIVSNLQKNLDLNRDVISHNHGSVESQALDWSDEGCAPRSAQDKFKVVLAADPIYSSDHPKMLVNALRRWIHWEPDVRFIVELPLRDRYDEERQDLRRCLAESGFELVVEGTDSGHDEWQARDGRPAEVACWWSVWKPQFS